jgi:hypothetical protein
MQHPLRTPRLRFSQIVSIRANLKHQDPCVAGNTRPLARHVLSLAITELADLVSMRQVA